MVKIISYQYAGLHNLLDTPLFNLNFYPKSGSFNYTAMMLKLRLVIRNVSVIINPDHQNASLIMFQSVGVTPVLDLHDRTDGRLLIFYNIPYTTPQTPEAPRESRSTA